MDGKSSSLSSRLLEDWSTTNAFFLTVKGQPSLFLQKGDKYQSEKNFKLTIFCNILLSCLNCRKKDG